MALGADHEVQVRGAVGGAPGRVEQPADGPVVRDRVGGGRQRPEPERPVFVAEQVGTPVDPAVAVLHVVEALLVGLPYLDARRVRDRGAAADVAAEPGVRGVLDEEGAENGRLPVMVHDSTLLADMAGTGVRTGCVPTGHSNRMISGSRARSRPLRCARVPSGRVSAEAKQR
ncbi:hypothetical protein GCM10009605_43260 [Nocardiopsis composta]